MNRLDRGATGVRLPTVRGGPQELRRAVPARLPGPSTPELDAVADALRRAHRR